MANKRTSKKIKYSNKKVSNNSSNSNFVGVVRVVMCVLILFLLFYLLTLYILNKKEPYNVVNNASIQYTEILAGEIFNQDSDRYIVLFYDKDSEIAEKYNTMVADYKAKSSHKDIYIVDLGEGLNKKYLSSDQENINVTDISDLKVKRATLLYIVDGKIEQSVVENINQFLNDN